MTAPGPARSELRPTFLLAGAARSGTTAVMDELRRHPQVFVTDPKEPHVLAFGDRPPTFRGPGDDETVNRLSVTDPDAYRDLFRGGVDRQRGEGSVSTLYYAAQALPRMREFAPDAHVFVILRDPVARAFSAHQYLRARGFEPLEDFRAALAAEPQRIRDGWQHLWHYAAMGEYGAQLRAFVDDIGPERLTVLFHDDLVEDWSGVIGAMCSRLGVAAPDRSAGSPVNTSGRPRSALVQAVLRWPTRHPRVRAVGRRLVPYRTWHRLRDANLARAEIPPAAAAELGDRFASDLALLRTLLDDMPGSVHGRRPPWLADPATAP